MNKSRIIFCMSIFALALAGCNQASPKKHVHKFSDEWVSDEAYHWHPATCGHNVKSGEAEHTPGDPVRENEQSATCTEDGSYQEVVYCTICNRELSRTDRTESATGHNWSNPTYVWNEENTQCTASRYCLNNNSHTETETTENIVKVTITELDCETDGSYTYTATFVNSAFAATKNETIPATGHDWGNPSYKWSEDNSSCTATVVCNHNNSHVITETVDTTYVETTAPTIEEDGSGTYSADFTKSPFEDKTKVVVIPATGTLDKLAFELSDDESFYSVKAATSSISDTVVIPATYEGKPVKRIAKNGFYNCYNISKLVIPDGVEVLGETSIYLTSTLTTLRLPNTLQYIEPAAINTSASVYNLKYYKCGRYAGNTENPYLVFVVQSSKWDDVTEIHEDCKFMYDEALMENQYTGSVVFPEGFIQIGKRACYNLKSLTTITLPTTLKHIGDECFYRNSTPSFDLYDGLLTIGKGAFQSSWGLKSITIPGTVKTIGAQTFTQCTLLAEINLNEGLEEIGTLAFQQCGVKSLVLPSTLRTLDYESFASAYQLESVIIRNGLTSIPGGCFKCEKLTSVTLPTSITEIGSGGFSYCYNLKSINYEGTMAQWNQISLDQWWKNEYTPITTVNCSDGSIPV